MTVDSQMILIPGNLIVGANLAAEYIRVTNTITGMGEGNVVLTLNPVAKFSEIPAVWGLPQSTRTITTWYISNQSETEIKMEMLCCVVLIAERLLLQRDQRRGR